MKNSIAKGKLMKEKEQISDVNRLQKKERERKK